MVNVHNQARCVGTKMTSRQKNKDYGKNAKLDIFADFETPKTTSVLKTRAKKLQTIFVHLSYVKT